MGNFPFKTYSISPVNLSASLVLPVGRHSPRRKTLIPLVMKHNTLCVYGSHLSRQTAVKWMEDLEEQCNIMPFKQ